MSVDPVLALYLLVLTCILDAWLQLIAEGSAKLSSVSLIDVCVCIDPGVTVVLQVPSGGGGGGGVSVAAGGGGGGAAEPEEKKEEKEEEKVCYSTQPSRTVGYSPGVIRKSRTMIWASGCSIRLACRLCRLRCYAENGLPTATVLLVRLCALKLCFVDVRRMCRGPDWAGL